MATKIKVSSGDKFNKLTILKVIPGGSHYMLRCKCDCGNQLIARKSDVLRGHTASCGCLNRKHKKKGNGVVWNKGDKKFHVRWEGRVVGRFYDEDQAKLYYKIKRGY